MGQTEIIKIANNYSEEIKSLSANEKIQELASQNIHAERNDYHELVRKVQNISSNYIDIKVSHPNALEKTETPYLKPPFTASIGPTYKSGSMTWNLKNELRTRIDAINNMNALFKTTKDFLQASNSYRDNINHGNQDLNNFSLNLKVKLNSLIQYLGNNKDRFSTSQLIVNYFYFCALIPSILLLAGVFISVMLRYKCGTIFLQCSWILSMILAIVGCFLLIGLFSIGSFIKSSCELYEKISTEKTSLESEWGLNSGLEVARQCNIGQYNALISNFHYKSSLDISSTIKQSFNDLNSNFQFSRVMIVINSNKVQSIIDNYERALIDESKIALGHLNKYSNYETQNSYQRSQGNCQISLDYWSFHDKDCEGKVHYNSNLYPRYNFGLNLCIPFDETADPNFATKRYTENDFQDCFKPIPNFNSIPKALHSFYESLFVYRKEVKTIFGNLLKDLTIYDQSVTHYDSKLRYRGIHTKSYQSEFNNFFFMQKKLEKGLNCKFVQKNVNLVRNGYCITSINGALYAMMAVAGISILLVFLGVLNCLIAIRLAPRENFIEELQETTNIKEIRKDSILY